MKAGGVKESPLAEILCRPEGSALFFHKCGDTCDLDADTQTELTISECRFEAESELPEGGDYIRHINRFGGSFTRVENVKSSGPERGDVPKKTNDVVALAATPLLVASTISNEAGESSSELDQPGDYPVTDYDAFNRMLSLCKVFLSSWSWFRPS